MHTTIQIRLLVMFALSLSLKVVSVAIVEGSTVCNKWVSMVVNKLGSKDPERREGLVIGTVRSVMLTILRSRRLALSATFRNLRVVLGPIPCREEVEKEGGEQ